MALQVHWSEEPDFAGIVLRSSPGGAEITGNKLEPMELISVISANCSPRTAAASDVVSSSVPTREDEPLTNETVQEYLDSDDVKWFLVSSTKMTAEGKPKQGWLKKDFVVLAELRQLGADIANTNMTEGDDVLVLKKTQISCCVKDLTSKEVHWVPLTILAPEDDSSDDDDSEMGSDVDVSEDEDGPPREKLRRSNRLHKKHSSSKKGPALGAFAGYRDEEDDIQPSPSKSSSKSVKSILKETVPTPRRKRRKVEESPEEDAGGLFSD